MVVDTVKKIGDFANLVGEKLLELIPNQFLQAPTTSKIVSIIVYVILIYLALHFAESIKKPVAYILVLLFVLLIVSIASTFIP